MKQLSLLSIGILCGALVIGCARQDSSDDSPASPGSGPGSSPAPGKNALKQKENIRIDFDNANSNFDMKMFEIELSNNSYSIDQFNASLKVLSDEIGNFYDDIPAHKKCDEPGMYTSKMPRNELLSFESFIASLVSDSNEFEEFKHWTGHYSPERFKSEAGSQKANYRSDVDPRFALSLVTLRDVPNETTPIRDLLQVGGSGDGIYGLMVQTMPKIKISDKLTMLFFEKADFFIFNAKTRQLTKKQYLTTITQSEEERSMGLSSKASHIKTYQVDFSKTSAAGLHLLEGKDGTGTMKSSLVLKDGKVQTEYHESLEDRKTDVNYSYLVQEEKVGKIMEKCLQPQQ